MALKVKAKEKLQKIGKYANSYRYVMMPELTHLPLKLPDFFMAVTILSLVHPVRKLAHDTNKASISIIKNLLFIISFPFFLSLRAKIRFFKRIFRKLMWKS